MFKLIRLHQRKIISVIIIALFCLGLWQLIAASWIQGKAIVAQQLLVISWHKTQQKNENSDNLNMHKPWPWADTWPIAKIIIPKHNIEQIVLAGDGGNSLAFAPGHSFASAAPNSTGTAVISGHRDTHFNFLKQLEIGETIYLQTKNITIGYQVHHIEIVDSNTFELQTINDTKNITLVTCYPFYSLSNSSSLRYLIYATAII